MYPMGKTQRNGTLVRVKATATHFEYDEVTPSVARFLREQADRIRRSAAASVINIGKDLAAAKHYLSHGLFLTWVESEVGIPARTAQVYMQVALWAARKNATVAHLPPSLLYLLSAPSTPKVFIDEILKRVEGGQPVVLKNVREELRALRSGKRDDRCTTASFQEHANSADPESEIAASNDCNTRVLEAVAIFMRALSPSDFAKIRELLTSKSVLSDPDLSHSIETAFWTVEGTVDVSMASDETLARHEDDMRHRTRATMSSRATVS
jgi:DUF3102 family protein